MENKTSIFTFMDRFLHQHNIHSDFYILNPQTNTQNQKLLREEMNPKKKEPKNNNNKELIPLNFSPI